MSQYPSHAVHFDRTIVLWAAENSGPSIFFDFPCHHAVFCSQVDLILLPLTSIPIVGFWKLLPTFGGCIATKAYCSLSGENNDVVEVGFPRSDRGCASVLVKSRFCINSKTYNNVIANSRADAYIQESPVVYYPRVKPSRIHPCA